jgi:hypothetical protein
MLNCKQLSGSVSHSDYKFNTLVTAQDSLALHKRVSSSNTNIQLIQECSMLDLVDVFRKEGKGFIGK